MKIDINEILSIIPHRYPFLLIDRVIELTLNQSIIGIKNVTINEPQFTGHFPNRPVMPGVLIIEAMAQLSAVLVAKSMNSTKDKEVFFMSIDDSKFRKVVEPGDSLIISSAIIQNRGSVWKFKSQAEVDGILAAESTFTAMVKDK
ncbi:MAG: 3-hydroxyacyl-ACP dehydratase FabZ [Rickettsiales bacterium]|nr:MAG: 3-hydroxyacyl-ACP dehydratase FabZ [Rickettsiales bacterium]